MNVNGPGRSHIVVAGGGAAALEGVIALRSLLGSRPAITIVAPTPEFVYEPLTVKEPFDRRESPRLNLREFARDHQAVFSEDGLESVGRANSVQLASGALVPFDKLLVATGAPREPAFPEAITFRGHADTSAVRTVVDDVDAGRVARIAVVVPAGVAWALPAYELALMLAARSSDLEVVFVTPEDRPLGLFGGKPSSDVEELIAQAGIRLITRATAEVPNATTVVTHPGGETIECDRVIALPITRGRRIWGLPSDGDGFVPIDRSGRVAGLRDVYAAGDATNFPLKQGGIACQQADAAAEHIAHSLGADVDPSPFRPVLRGQLLTGATPQFMRHDVTRRRESDEHSSVHPLWWPATKIAGKYLSAYLVGRSENGSHEIAPGVRRRGFLAPATDGDLELSLRGYEYEARWGGRRAP